MLPICYLVFAAVLIYAAPAPSMLSSAAQTVPTVSYASNDPNRIIYGLDTDLLEPEPIRGSIGASILGPHNVKLGQENPDLLAPPTTDEGSL